MPSLTMPFTEEDAQRASDEWGCNCGPGALAFALQVPLDRVRSLIPDFDKKRYTSPTMMKAALAAAGRAFVPCTTLNPKRFRSGVHVVELETEPALFDIKPTLVRVQWNGPWTAEGSNPKWAYQHTHWVCMYLYELTTGFEVAQVAAVFDINGGARRFYSWCTDILPLLVNYPRCDRTWTITHAWRLK